MMWSGQDCWAPRKFPGNTRGRHPTAESSRGFSDTVAPVVVFVLAAGMVSGGPTESSWRALIFVKNCAGAGANRPSLAMLAKATAAGNFPFRVQRLPTLVSHGQGAPLVSFESNLMCEH